MVPRLHLHRSFRLTNERGDAYPNSRAGEPDPIGSPLRAGIRRFPQTISALLSARSIGGLIGAIPLAFLLTLIAPLQNGWAQAVGSGQTAPGNLKQLSLAELGDVQVTTISKEPQQVQRTPAAVFVITQEDIRRSGATNIPEALRMAPGVEVARIDADHWSVAIRGFAGQFSKSLLVLIDGRSVYTPLFDGVYWDVQSVMLEDIERIEVIRGPGGTIWGANAVNGVINIITKSSTETQGALVALGGGNVDQGTGAVRYGASAGKDFNYRIYGTGSIRGPEHHSDTDPFDDFRMGQMGFRTDWKANDKNTLTVQGDIYGALSGESFQLATYSPPAEIVAVDRANVSGGNLLARWQHTTGEGSDIQVQTYFDRTNRQDLELGETRDTFDVDFVQHVRVHSDQELTWGLGARVSPSNYIQIAPGVNFQPNKQADNIYSGFVQYELPIVRDKLMLTAGTKLEHNNFSGFDYQPSVRLLWALTEHQSLWTAVTRAVRTPSRIDDDVQFNIFVENTPTAPVYFEILGNPKQKAEQLIGYEAGYRTQVSRNLYLDFTGFYNSYRDLQNYGPLGLTESANPPPLRLLIVVPYANGIQGNTAGGEVASNWKVTHWWQVRGSYSFLHMGLENKHGYTDTGGLLASYEGSSPRHVVSFQSLFNLPKHFELDGTFRHSSALPAQIGLPGQVVKAYSTADVRLGWRGGERLDFSVVGQNLLQPYHNEFGGDPGPLVGIKRAVYAKITWAIDAK
jgi:iron complex outermembrane receptor protein